MGRLLNLSWRSHPGLRVPEGQFPVVSLPLVLTQQFRGGGEYRATVLPSLMTETKTKSYIFETPLQLNHNVLDNER